MTPNEPSHPVPPPSGYYYPPTVPDDEIDLLELWRVVMNYKWLIVAITLATTSLATAAAFIMTPIYRVEVLLAPVTDDKAGGLAALAGQFGGLASLAGIDIGGGGNNTGQSIAFLKSRAFTEEFVRDNNLLPVLFYKKWDADEQVWKVEKPQDIPTMWQAFELFDKKIRFVSEDKKTGLVTLSIEWHDRELAAQWAAELVQRINKTMRERAITEAEKSLKFLNQELQKTSIVDVQQSIYKLIEGQTKTMMLANVREEYAFKVIDPPAVPDEGKFIKPKRLLLIIVGFVIGVILGILVVFIKQPRSHAKSVIVE